MPRVTCPECRTELEHVPGDEHAGATCPFCGAELPCGIESDPPADDIAKLSSAVRGSISDAPPAGGRLQVAESSNDRMVWYIPASGRSVRFLAFFAIVWNGILSVITSILLFSGARVNGHPGPIGMTLFLSLFWIVGLVLLAIWVRLRFERLIVLVEDGRMVLQRTLFGRQRREELPLDRTSRSYLVESHSVNDRAVHKIVIESSAGQVSFGTTLTPAEKDWCVDRINQFIGVLPETIEGGDSAAAPDAEPESDHFTPEPDSFPNSHLRVIEDEPEELAFEMPGIDQPIIRFMMVAFTSVFSLVWYGIAFGAMGLGAFAPGIGPMRFVVVLMAMLFLGLGLLPLTLAAFALRGKVSVRLNADQFSCRYHVGPFGRTWTFPTSEITTVRAEIVQTSDPNPRARSSPRTPRSGSERVGCVVRAGDRTVYVVSLGEDSSGRHAASLLRIKLRDLGRYL